MFGRVEAVTLLLDRGAEASVRSADATTILIRASHGPEEPGDAVTDPGRLTPGRSGQLRGRVTIPVSCHTFRRLVGARVPGGPLLPLLLVAS